MSIIEYILEYVLEYTRAVRVIPGAWLVVLLLGMAFLGYVWWRLAEQNERD